MKESKKIQKINEFKSWFFEKINKTNQIHQEKERVWTQINKIRSERGDTTTDTKKNSKDCKKIL